MMSSKHAADDLEATERKKKWGCWSFGCLFLVVGPIFFIGSLAIFFVGRERAAAARLKSFLTELESKGLPHDSASLGTFYNSMTSDENVTEWKRLLQVLASEEFTSSIKGVPLFDGQVDFTPPPPGQVWEHEEATRKFLDRWQTVYSGLRDLSLDQLHPDAKPLRLQLKFEGFLTNLNTQQSMRNVARLIQLSAMLSIIDRNAMSTRVDIEALMGCSQALSAEPHLVGQLIHVAVNGMAIGTLQSAIEHDVLDERQLNILLPKLTSRLGISKTWKTAIQGERATGIEAFRNPSLLGEPGLANVPMRSKDALYYAEYMGRVLEVTDDDVNLFLAGLQAEEQRLQAIMNSGPLMRFDSLLTFTVSPAVGAMGQAFARNTLSHRIAALAVGVRLYEKKHGQFPASLEELSEFKLDIRKIVPSGQKPFGYEVIDGKAAIWGPEARPFLNIEVSTPTSPPVIHPENGPTDSNMLWLLPASSRR
jgi:hypothetical protein